MSITDVITIMLEVFCAKSFAKLTTESIFSLFIESTESTPLVLLLPTARHLISDKFPRITLNFTVSRSFFAVSALNLDAPAPTGSRTTG